ncbi:GNAT family N-acetyltransferase [Photobacterium nomapromontoriensis]|uniref:GNAT family N-acetyltransferase n=1 Tax=Photobacterium nomapromontoriensis TaxID=2910237 RepID=UPI003D0DF2D8
MHDNMAFMTARLHAAGLDRTFSGLHNEIMSIFTERVSRFLPPACQQLNSPVLVDQWLDSMQATGEIIRLTSEGQVIGYLFVFPDGQLYRVGYVIAEASWGKGFATEAMQGLVEHLIQQQQAEAFIAGVEPENKGSINVLTKLGFVYAYNEQDIDYYRLTVNG